MSTVISYTLFSTAVKYDHNKDVKEQREKKQRQLKEIDDARKQSKKTPGTCDRIDWQPIDGLMDPWIGQMDEWMDWWMHG